MLTVLYVEVMNSHKRIIKSANGQCCLRQIFLCIFSLNSLTSCWWRFSKTENGHRIPFCQMMFTMFTILYQHVSIQTLRLNAKHMGAEAGGVVPGFALFYYLVRNYKAHDHWMRIHQTSFKNTIATLMINKKNNSFKVSSPKNVFGTVFFFLIMNYAFLLSDCGLLW